MMCSAILYKGVKDRTLLSHPELIHRSVLVHAYCLSSCTLREGQGSESTLYLGSAPVLVWLIETYLAISVAYSSRITHHRLDKNSYAEYKPLTTERYHCATHTLIVGQPLLLFLSLSLSLSLSL